MEQTDLRTRRTAARLAFADHMNRFIAGERAPSSPEGAKMLACAYPALDRPMILFQDVVEILHRSMPAILLQSLLGFEPHDGRWITGVLVGIDDPRPGWFSPPKALARKRSAAAASRLADRRNSIVVPVESTARYKYTHLPLTRM